MISATIEGFSAETEVKGEGSHSWHVYCPQKSCPFKNSGHANARPHFVEMMTCFALFFGPDECPYQLSFVWIGLDVYVAKGAQVNAQLCQAKKSTTRLIL